MAAPKPAPMESLEAAPVKLGLLGVVGVPLEVGLSVTMTLGLPVAIMLGLAVVLFMPAVGYGVTMVDVSTTLLLLTT